MKSFVLLATLSAFTIFAGDASAGCPKVFVNGHHKAAVVLQQVAAYPVVQYQVGAQVQQEAVIEAAVSRALARFQATVTQTTTRTEISSGGVGGSGVSGAAQGAVQSQSVGQFARCTKCHSGESAKGNFRVDVELSCEDRLRAISAMLHDDDSKRMPKGASLPADELGRLIQAFSVPISTVRGE